MLFYPVSSILFYAAFINSIPYQSVLFQSGICCLFLFVSVRFCSNLLFFSPLFSCFVLLYYSILYSVLFSSVLYMYYSIIYLLHITLSLPINRLLLGPEGAESRIRGRSFYKSCRVGMAGSQNRLAVL